MRQKKVGSIFRKNLGSKNVRKIFGNFRKFLIFFEKSQYQNFEISKELNKKVDEKSRIQKKREKKNEHFEKFEIFEKIQKKTEVKNLKLLKNLKRKINDFSKF